MLDQGHVRRRSPTFRSGLMLIYREDALYSCGLEIRGLGLGWGYSIKGSGNSEKMPLKLSRLALLAVATGSVGRRRVRGEPLSSEAL